MNSNELIGNIQNKLSKYFDIEETYTYKNIDFNTFAKSYVRNEKYIASKKAVIYAFENNEFIFVKSYANLDEKKLLQFQSTLINATEDFVNPHSEHMSSIITGIIVLESSLNKELEKEIEKFKFNKNFAFGLKGWVYIRLLVIDLSKGEMITNKRGREVRKFYQI